MPTPELEHLIYPFGSPPAGDPPQQTALLGAKGAGLARMWALGQPVPPGFTVPTTVCRRVLTGGWFPELDEAIADAVAELEALLARRLGSPHAPLLVSVRSGAPVSMPGMMDTVLNVGISADVADALCRRSGDGRFGWDTYRRFVEGYATIVAGAPKDLIEQTASGATGGRGWNELADDELAAAVVAWRAALAAHGHVVPDEPRDQVRAAVAAVFASWNSERAQVYRRREGIAADLFTAATVQAMVFGNVGSDSGSGVVFTRDPSTGSAGLVGDFLARAQGEDVVSGTHQTLPITELARLWPEVADELARVAGVLEHELADMVDIEFTVENRRLWLLQARVGKRSPRAALRLAVAMAEDPAFPLDRAGAVARVSDLLDDPPTVPDAGSDSDGAGDAVVVAEGLAASPGRAVGVISVDADDAAVRASQGQAVILVRPETSPADVHGMVEARGLVTRNGGLVSHAAVVARSWGLPAVVGAAGLSIDAEGITAGGHRLAVGTEITVDGDRGLMLLGAHPDHGTVMDEVGVLRRWQSETATPASPVTKATPATTATQAGTGRTGAEPGHGPDRDRVAAECLRLLVLKGLASARSLATAAEVTEDVVAAELERLVTAGDVTQGPGGRFLLTPHGTARAEVAHAAEAVTAGPAIEPEMERFHQLDKRLKEVVTDWQIRTVDGQQVMNDHTDPDHDAAVIRALALDVHEGICAVIDVASRGLARLARYRHRLSTALAAIEAGDERMVAHPLEDSYHTVWFELHEELIRLTGRNRSDEAAAGRA